jgi:3-oxoacyl-[acyl-carrier protein] reductase
MKTVLITGASRGIGRAAAELFAAHGYQVLINYYRSQAVAGELRDQLRFAGGSVELFRADVTDSRQVDAMVDFGVERFGGIDVLVNNAGIAQNALLIDLTDADWDAMMAANLKSVFLCSRSVLRYMLPRRSGKIINIASIWGMVGAACEVHYSAAKAGVIGLTKALAKELGPSNIQVNSIAPGIIRTDMLNGLSPEDLGGLAETTPLQRLGTPADVAGVALFLASDAADFLTGQVISPNGGFVI